jgi:uncharacterized protein YndB with AHSA1/START domain
MQAVERFATSASPETVWQVLADLEHWKDWNQTILDVTPLTDKGLQVGAQYRVAQRGVRPAVYEVTHCSENESFTWVQKFPGGQLIADHRVIVRNGATEVELSFIPKGPLANIAVLLFGNKIRSYVATEARGLKLRCEAMSQTR